jgi:hypothetical protein
LALRDASQTKIVKGEHVTTPIVVRSQGVSLLLLVLAIVCFLISAFGVDTKLGINLVDLGLAFFAGSFIL